ncbi:MAG: hypothetical protein UX54_C0030G0011 [Parcubacteria group bacterium GW2011_GWA2_46_39]|nr:MAG: hypothetical protein UX54_C0030G0011 [Parcubacteria group bacterium GW2011_GWA2_46_39]
MIAVRFTPSFVRQIQSLSDEIQEEIFQKVNRKNEVLFHAIGDHDVYKD